MEISRVQMQKAPLRGQSPTGTSTNTYLGAILISWLVLLVGSSILWPRYAAIASIGPIKLSPYSALALATWLLGPAILSRSAKMRLMLSRNMRSIILIALLTGAWYLWRLFADFIGIAPSDAVSATLRDLLYYSVFFPVGVLISTDKSAKTLVVRSLVVCSLIVILIGLAQIFIHFNLALLFHIDVATDSMSRVVYASQMRGALYRAKSVFYHPLVFAEFISMIVPLLIHVARFDRNFAIRMIAATSILLGSLDLFETGSRAALVALPASVGLYFVISIGGRWLRKPVPAFMAILAVAATLFVALPTLSAITQGRNDIERSSSFARQQMLRLAIQGFQARPVAGVGEGGSIYVAGVRGEEETLTIDSAILQSVLDFGAVGLVLMLGVWISIAWRGFRKATDPDSPLPERSLASALTALAISFFVIQGVLALADNTSLLFLSAGLLASPKILARMRGSRKFTKANFRSQSWRTELATSQPSPT